MIIKEVKFDSEEYKKTVALRDEVLRQPLGLAFSAEELSNEFDSFHLAALNEEDEVIACLVLKPEHDGAIKMRQVAVREEARERGIGQLLVNFAEIFALDQGFVRMAAHARETATEFYLKMDYQKTGDAFEEIGIPHYRVEKQLNT